MSILFYICSFLTASLHVFFFYLESLVFHKEEVYTRFLVTPDTVEAVQLWAYNQGFYNLLLALIIFFGLIQLMRSKNSGIHYIRAASFVCFFAGVALFFSAPELQKSAIIQSTPALLCFLLSFLKKT